MLREDTEDLVQGIFSNLVVSKCGGAGGKVGVGSWAAEGRAATWVAPAPGYEPRIAKIEADSLAHLVMFLRLARNLPFRHHTSQQRRNAKPKE